MRDKETFPRILELVKIYRGWLFIAMFFMIMVALFSALQAYMIQPLIDKIFIEQDRLMMKLVPAALVLVFIFKGAFHYGYEYLLNKVGQSVIRDLRNKIYVHVQSLPLSFFHKTPTGELISRVISDVTLIQGAVSHVLIGVMKDFFTIVGMIIVVFYMNWQLAIISMIFLPMLIYPIVQFGRKHRKLSTQNQETTALVSNILYETITGNRIVKAFCMEEKEATRFSTMLDKLFSIIMRDAKYHCLAHPVNEIFGGFGIAFVTWYGGMQVLNGTSTTGSFFSFLGALIMIYEPLKGLSKVNNTFQQGVAAAVRVFTLLDIQSDVAEKNNAIVLPTLQDTIIFEHVYFSYDGSTNVLKDINLNVRNGEVIALVGSSGGGKSTFVNLIPRFADVTSGSISIDGHDIRDVTLNSLRNQTGIVTQQTILFNDTVKNNIAYGSSESSDEDIESAALAAYALDFIKQLPEGFDTVIGESGARLSGGERQRISIARALLKNAPILILDEATSSLDTESEREVQEALVNLMKDRTTFVIAHRLSTVRNADRIIVIQDGRIVEEGTHEYLLPLKGVYTTLHEMQFKD